MTKIPKKVRCVNTQTGRVKMIAEPITKKPFFRNQGWMVQELEEGEEESTVTEKTPKVEGKLIDVDAKRKEVASKAEEERLAAEAEAKRLADEGAAAKAEEERLAAEAEAQRLADEEAASKAEEERLAAEAETKRLADEEVARKAEEERLAAEAEANRLADEEAARLAEEERLAAEVEKENSQAEIEKEQFKADLVSIKGIGPKSADDIIEIYENRTNLLEAVNSKDDLPFTADAKKALEAAYKN